MAVEECDWSVTGTWLDHLMAIALEDVSSAPSLTSWRYSSLSVSARH